MKTDQTDLTERIKEILAGAYDLHTHTAPSHFPKALDDVELARRCDAYGLAGALIKNHYEPTASRATLANKYGGAKAKLFGGIALNRPVGGLNPYAAECALRLGAKIVWLPTRDSENCLRQGGKPTDFFQRFPVCVLDAEGKIAPELQDVLAVVKKHDAWLATGHVSPAEAAVICGEARRQGVRMILTHPDWKQTKYSLDQQTDLARQGVMVEKVWGNVSGGHIVIEEMAASIRALGKDSVFLTTDYGQPDNLSPPRGMHNFVAALLTAGILDGDVKTMVCDNPAHMMGQ
jgi:hypothetical protein